MSDIHFTPASIPEDVGVEEGRYRYSCPTEWPYWRCPDCGCRTHAQVHEQKADRSFGPGPLIRCVECKSVFDTRPAAPSRDQGDGGDLGELVHRLREEVINREARRREILESLEDQIGTAWNCRHCQYSTYHSMAYECADCGAEMPDLHRLAFKLHARNTDNEELINEVRAAFDEEGAYRSGKLSTREGTGTGAPASPTGLLPKGDAPYGPSSQATAIPSRKWPASYQEAFDAIAAAVTIHSGKSISISVKAFYRALSYPDSAGAPPGFAAAIPSGGWMPIETAPKDGTDVLLYADAWDWTWGIQIGRFKQGQWFTAEGSVDENEAGFDPDAEVDQDFDPDELKNIGPTHWMPIPRPPSASADGNPPGEDAPGAAESRSDASAVGEAETPQASPQDPNPPMSVEEAREVLEGLDPRFTIADHASVLRKLAGEPECHPDHREELLSEASRIEAALRTLSENAAPSEAPITTGADE